MTDVVSMEEKERRRAEKEEKRAKEKRAKRELKRGRQRLDGNLGQTDGPSLPQMAHAMQLPCNTALAEIESENLHDIWLEGNLGQGHADSPGDPNAGFYPDFDLTRLGDSFWEWQMFVEDNFTSDDAVAGEPSDGEPRLPDHSPDRSLENDQGTGIAAQLSTVSCDDMVYTEIPASASEKPSTGNDPKIHDSVRPDETMPSSATLGSSQIQLPPSPDPTEKPSRTDGSPPPKIPPPASLVEEIAPAPDASTKGQHKPARLEIVLSSPSCRERAAEASASRPKRRHQESNAGADVQTDNEGGTAAKRLKPQAIHSNTLPSPSNPATRKNGAGRHNSRTAIPRTRKRPSPRSRHVSASQGSNNNLDRPGHSQNPGIASGTQQTSGDALSDGPRTSAECGQAALSECNIGLSPPSREMPVDGCSTCGFCAADLVRLADKAWRWIPNDNSVEALFGSTAGLSDIKSLVMLRLSLGSIRDFAREMATTDRESRNLIRPSTLIKSDKTERIANDTSDGGDHSSDGPDSDSSKGFSKSGQRRKWSALDDGRLEAYKKEAKSEQWIARRLGRTEAAVSQHWIIMCRKKAKMA